MHGSRRRRRAERRGLALAAGVAGVLALTICAGRESGPRLAAVALGPVRLAGGDERAPTLLSMPLSAERRPVAGASAAARIDGPRAVDRSSEAAGDVDARLRALIGDLRADDVPGNATTAHTGIAALGAAAQPALEAALNSVDRQQRTRAAELLRSLGGTISPRLLDVTMESLTWWGDDRDDYALHLLRRSAEWLEAHVDVARDRLLRGLNARDGQQRLYCAAILARTHCPRSVGRICDVLIGHLADNDVRADARLAFVALFEYVDVAWSLIVLAKQGADRQTWTALRAIELQHVERTAEEDVELRALSWNAGEYLCLERDDPPWHHTLPHGAELARQ